MHSRKRILLIGSANMDLSMNMYRIPRAGETLIDDGGVAYTPGGKGANSAVAFARLGAECVFVARLGRDTHGQRLYSFYKETGLNTSFIKVDTENPTGLAVVMRESDGQNRIIYYPGANLTITNEQILEAFECQPDAVYLGFEISFETALFCARIAHQRGIPIFIDSAPADKNARLEDLPPVEVFSPNETETLEYTGILPTGSESCMRSAFSLYKRVKCKYVVIKLGSRGSFIYDGKNCRMASPYQPDRVVDTTGAGDAFTSALTLEYLESGDIMSAVKYASAVGALTVMRQGASSSIPTREEVLQFIKTHPYV